MSPMSKSALHQQMKKIGLERLAGPILAGARPSLRLTVGKPSVRPASRLGGRPNLPKDIPWPVWQGGEPLSFIAQLDLAGLPTVRGLALPRKGSLFFFYDANGQFSGHDPKLQGGAQVFYTASPLAAHGARAWPRNLNPESRFKGLALSAVPEISLPAMDHDFETEYQVTGEEARIYLEFAPLAYGEHRMGGNAVPINGADPRFEAQLVSHGINCGDSHGYDEGRRLGLQAGAVDWLLLLQLDSGDNCAGMQFGCEGGRIYFMIHKDDLRRRRFDRIHLTLQYTI
jgi:uncharacterized protein YwqG